VRDYEELIALLKEKRQALVSHAVTRGLSELVSPDDPDFGEWARPVAFKGSCVEWLGEIPEGWKVLKLKRLSPKSLHNIFQTKGCLIFMVVMFLRGI
jgi:type I restriction enzyme S subunit